MLTATRLEWADMAALASAPETRACVHGLMVEAEARRVLADYNTGSITEDEACALLALVNYLDTRVVIEVGTFIGLSTTALAAGAHISDVYTCDASNDCLPSRGAVRCYPKQTSTQMLRDLRHRGVRADLCFVDGVLQADDADLLESLTHARTVFAFHDYNYGPKIRQKHGTTYQETMPRKDIGNVRLMGPRLPDHTLIEPLGGTTLALLVPESRL